jgi:hypothetical protein
VKPDTLTRSMEPPRLSPIPPSSMPIDPGWNPALRRFLTVMIPIIGPLRARRALSTKAEGLTAIRVIFLALVFAFLLFVYVLTFITPWDGGDESWFLWAVIVVGAIALSLLSWARRRPLDVSTLRRLGATYRSNMFIGIGAAESAVATGLAGAFFGGSLWVYLVGLAFGLVGLSLAAPSVRDIERRQVEIAASGSTLSLVEALMGTRSA